MLRPSGQSQKINQFELDDVLDILKYIVHTGNTPPVKLVNYTENMKKGSDLKKRYAYNKIEYKLLI